MEDSWNNECQNKKNPGLQFIELNSASVSDETIQKPAGFDIIFPGMIEYAKDLNLAIPLGSEVVDAMIQKRDLDLRRYIYSCSLPYSDETESLYFDTSLISQPLLI